MRRHIGNRYFAKLDIQNFFGSISRNRIQRVLKGIGFSLADAQTIAQRSCVLMDGRRVLPFGYSQSPFLASLVLDKSALGQEIRRIRDEDIAVTVFMDDILLSHVDKAVLENAYQRLVSAAVEAKFELSQKKLQSPAESVTAFNIDMDSKELVISPEKFEEFSRRVLKQGVTDPVIGILGYVATVNGGQSNALRALATG